MSARILEGGGLLGGYSFDKTEAEPDTHLAGQIDDDAVGAMVRLQCASEEYLRAQNDETQRRPRGCGISHKAHRRPAVSRLRVVGQFETWP